MPCVSSTGKYDSRVSLFRPAGLVRNTVILLSFFQTMVPVEQPHDFMRGKGTKPWEKKSLSPANQNLKLSSPHLTNRDTETAGPFPGLLRPCYEESARSLLSGHAGNTLCLFPMYCTEPVASYGVLRERAIHKIGNEVFLL
jgi:hypothetical protein